MRKLILGVFLALTLAPRSAHAQAVSVQPSTSTLCVPVTVSHTVVTAMQSVVDSSTTAPGLPTTLNIQNQDASNAIFCSQDSSVAVSGTTHLGYRIALATSQYFTMLGIQQWYCLAATANVQAVVCKIH